MKTSGLLNRLHINNPYKSHHCDVSNEFITAINNINKGNNAIYTDIAELRSFLEHNNVPDIDIGRFTLIASVPGFGKLMDDASANRIGKFSLDAFVVSAYEKTGLLKFIILEYLSVVFDSKGTVYQLSFADADAKLADIKAKGTAFYFPYPSYKSILNKDSFDIKDCESLMSLGVPMAYYIKGKHQLKAARLEALAKKEQDDSGETKEPTVLFSRPLNENALKNLKIASALGFDSASVELGRYYFELGQSYWENSYDYYSACGIDALSKEDRDNLISLINFNHYNKRMLLFSGLLWVITLVMACFIPGFSCYTGQTVYGIITLVLQAVIIGYGIHIHRKLPYIAVSLVTLLVFVLLMCFVTARIIF